MSSRRNRRSGFTLLEMLIATSMMTLLVVSAAVVLRGSYDSWRAFDADHELLNSASATVRHIVRSVRQATAVSAITPAADSSGALSLTMPSGETLVWDHDAAADQVNFGVGAASSLLAEGITELSFTGYRADGVTIAATPAQVRMVLCRATVQLPREAGGSRTMRSYAWIRSW